MITNKQLTPFSATHPGSLIADELSARTDMNQQELAHLLGVNKTFLNEIIKGKRPVTADTALLLETALGISADFWLRFQAQYDLDLARIKEKNIQKIKHIEIWEVVKNYIPHRILRKQGYLVEDIKTNIEKVFDIFSVNNVDEFIGKFAKNKLQLSPLYRKSEKLTADEKNLITWSSIAEYKAKNKKTKKFVSGDREKLIKELNEVFYMNDNVLEKIDIVLSNYGVKLLIVEKLSKTPVDGYSFWSDENPAIALTCRHKRIDNLAFTLMHELGHVYLHLSDNKEAVFLDVYENGTDHLEVSADKFARENLIPQENWAVFKQNKFPAKDKIIFEFADKFKINPAIVHGRMCYESKNYKLITSIDKKLN